MLLLYQSFDFQMAQNEKGDAAVTVAVPAAEKENGGVSYRGVTKRPRGRFTAQIGDPVRKSLLWLGTFDTPEEAARAYDMAAMRLRGTKAKTNFPPPTMISNDNMRYAHAPSVTVDSSPLNISISGGSSVGTAASFTYLKRNQHQSRRFPVAGDSSLSSARDYQYLEALTAAEVIHCEPSSQRGTVAFYGGGDSVSGCEIQSESESSSIFNYNFNERIIATKGLDLDLNLPPPENM
ncbi:hypothetical protein HAX54_009983 [Datura stramonium]|uniref:AP2/ERF domain-containing protein n=1 Tax=Datura stramonium TaxID=4076 RepID=A0ABS8TI72_DATST|nr:hypothetical protein [Datura stramonium]